VHYINFICKNEPTLSYMYGTANMLHDILTALEWLKIVFFTHLCLVYTVETLGIIIVVTHLINSIRVHYNNAYKILFNLPRRILISTLYSTFYTIIFVILGHFIIPCAYSCIFFATLRFLSWQIL